MEFKALAVSEKERLAEAAKEACMQIERQCYRQELEDRGTGRIICYGIAFSGKSVEIVSEESQKCCRQTVSPIN